MNVPVKIDGANVLFYIETDSDFGASIAPDGEERMITKLVIAEYDEDEGFYTFACDSEWNVFGDLFSFSIEEAFEQAKTFYELIEPNWKKSHRER